MRWRHESGFYFTVDKKFRIVLDGPNNWCLYDLRGAPKNNRYPVWTHIRTAKKAKEMAEFVKKRRYGHFHKDMGY